MGASLYRYEQPSSVNAGDHSHTVNSHSHSVGPHTHPIEAHYHSLNNHTHNVTVSAHTHIVDIDAHTHMIMTDNEKDGAWPTSCVLRGERYDMEPTALILPTRSKSKRILVAGWNTITVQPNDDARISAYVMVKITAN